MYFSTMHLASETLGPAIVWGANGSDCKKFDDLTFAISDPTNTLFSQLGSSTFTTNVRKVVAPDFPSPVATGSYNLIVMASLVSNPSLTKFYYLTASLPWQVPVNYSTAWSNAVEEYR